MRGVIATIVLLTATLWAQDSTAQIEARTNISRLPWLNGAPGVTFADFNKLWIPDFHEQQFILGWNWINSARPISSGLGFQVAHLGDDWISPWNTANKYLQAHRPGIVLVPTIDGLATSFDFNLNVRDKLASPNESNALEFAPWLDWNASTQRMVLEPKDLTGSVFGFRTKAIGVVEPPLTQAAPPSSTQYRYRLTANAVTERTLVLSEVWPDDQIRVFADAAEKRKVWRERHNTTQMFISVTLRRTSAATPDESQHANDEVLRITIPYWMGVADGNQVTGFIRFSTIEDATEPIEEHQVEGVTVGRRRETKIPVTGVTEEFVITRGMLPELANNPDMTVEAFFKCDWPITTPDIANALASRGAGDEKSNPFFYPNDVDVTSQDFPALISRYDVKVEYSGGIDVEIASIRLETPAARDLFWGDLDAQVVGPAAPNTTTPGAILQYFTNLEQRNTTLELDPANVLNDPQNPMHDRTSSVWRFYGRDEIMPMHWKAFRYLNRLLDGKLITEVGIWWEEGMRHCLGLKEFWQGATFPVHPGVASYAFEQGFKQPEQSIPAANVQARHENRILHAGLDRGRLSWGRDPDTQISDNNGNLTLPLTLAQQQNITNHNGGIQSHIEHYLFDHMRPHREMLFNQDPHRHWYANVWQFSAWDFGGTTTAADPHYLTAAPNARPKSCGELRAQMWSSLVLGAHGLLFYCGRDMPRTNDHVVPDPQLTTLDQDRVIDVGLVYFDHTAITQPAPTFSNILNSPAFGSDWLEDNDRSNADAWLFGSVQQVANALAAKTIATPRVYVGRQAMRQVTREVIGRLDRSALETLSRLKLRGWHARGFRTYSTSETEPDAASLLAARIDITPGSGSRLKTRPPGKTTVSPTDPDYPFNPGQPVWDPPESTFVDVTLLSDINDMSMSGGFYIGVFNRRTNPMMRIPRTDTLAFHAYDDVLNEWDAHPERLYDQEGAREIRLPFRVPSFVEQTSGRHRYRTLHITELGSGLPSGTVDYLPLLRQSIDTMIGQDGDLNIKLLPGEGRIFRVQFVDAQQEVARGWLDHNTQRKMVVHPNIALTPQDQPIMEPNGVETLPACIEDNGTGQIRNDILRVRDGDTWRCHMVYHRRQIPPVNPGDPETGPLSVFYRRSTPLTHTATGAFDDLEAGEITWEQEILINDHFMPPLDPATIPSCGFPSIVVRYDGIRKLNMVYIVYACETTEALPNQNVMIAEAQFPADDPNQNAWYHDPMQGSCILDYVRSSGIENNNRLFHWGTPVVNAAYDGNYYAWSDNIRGIVYGFKTPQQRAFPPGGLGQVKVHQMVDGIPWVAKYPTVHSYSRIRAGERDASLAWQEGPAANNGSGAVIMYTRLRHAWQTNAVGHYLSIAPAPVIPGVNLLLGGSTNAGEILDQGRVLVASQRQVAGGEWTTKNEKPTLLRLLSDFPDESMTSTSPWHQIGHLNHKPDRLVWEHTELENGMPRFGMLSHRVVDINDVCHVANDPVVSYLWTTPESWILSNVANTMLIQPELAHGEMKTELHVNALTHPEYVARSWEYDDSVMVLSFTSMPLGLRHGSLYQMTYGHDLYGIGLDRMLHTPLIDQLARVRSLLDIGRSPHVSARHNIVHSQGIFKGRRIYENADAEEQYANWNRAPQMTRSNEGFFKSKDVTRDRDVQTRAWDGFAGADGYATVTDLAINGKLLQLTRVNDDKLQKPRKVGPQQLVSEWISIDDVSALDMESRSPENEARVTVFFERERDNERVPFATFNGRRKQRWQLIPDAQERYRVVIENTAAELCFVTDLELMGDESSLGRQTEDVVQMLDLRRLGTALATAGEQAIEAWPQPAHDVLNVITQSGHTAAQGTLTIRDVRGTVVLQVPCKTIDLLPISTAGIPSGTYTATLDASGETLGRVLVSIVK